MIILLGSPGAGKTTQTKLLADYLNCPWLSMGDLIREYSTGEAREQMLKGIIIDDKTTLELLDKALKKYDLVNNEFVMEGNPRSTPQAEWWLEQVDQGRMQKPKVILLTTDPDQIKDRLEKRGRFDDNDSEVLNRRFAEYERSVTPTVAYLKDKGIEVHQIDGMGTIEEVAKRIHQALGLS